MQVKGLLEIRGTDGLIRPYLELDGQRLPLHPVWSREHCWIPRFVSEEQKLRFTCAYLTPVGERALVLRLTVQNQSADPRAVRFGTDGQLDQTQHEVNETTELTDGREAYESGWNHMFIFSQKPGLPLFAFAPCVADPQQFAEIDRQARWSRSGFAYDVYREPVLQPGETAVLDIPWGVGYEGLAASTSAKELLRQGFDAVYDRTVRWLSAREKPLADPKLHEILNTNLFFAFFYASGRTVDTEELCLHVEKTGDTAFAARPFVRDGLEEILRRMAAKKHPSVPLYETFLQPTDDMHNHIYLTYDNAGAGEAAGSPPADRAGGTHPPGGLRTLRQGAERAALLRMVGRSERLF